MESTTSNLLRNKQNVIIPRHILQGTYNCVTISQHLISRNIKCFNFPIKLVKRTTAFVISSHHISTRNIKIVIKPHYISSKINQKYDEFLSLNCKNLTNFSFFPFHFSQGTNKYNIRTKHMKAK